MSETPDPILAPLTRDMLRESAAVYMGLSPGTKTVETAVEFALWALKEADRLATPWKKRQQCAMKGHQFAMPEDDMPEHVLDGTTGTYILKKYIADKADCLNCDASLVIVFKEKI